MSASMVALEKSPLWGRKGDSVPTADINYLPLRLLAGSLSFLSRNVGGRGLGWPGQSTTPRHGFQAQREAYEVLMAFSLPGWEGEAWLWAGPCQGMGGDVYPAVSSIPGRHFMVIWESPGHFISLWRTTKQLSFDG